MKTVLFLLVLTIPSFAFCHTKPKQFDYTVVFGGCFENDTVQLNINKATVLKNYILHNQNPAIQGCLSLTQSDKSITIFYNGQTKKRRGIHTASHLTIELTVNNQVSRFNVDLRKGRVLLFDYCDTGSENSRKLTLEQVQEPMILM